MQMKNEEAYRIMKDLIQYTSERTLEFKTLTDACIVKWTNIIRRNITLIEKDGNPLAHAELRPCRELYRLSEIAWKDVRPSPPNNPVQCVLRQWSGAASKRSITGFHRITNGRMHSKCRNSWPMQAWDAWVRYWKKNLRRSMIL